MATLAYVRRNYLIWLQHRNETGNITYVGRIYFGVRVGSHYPEHGPFSRAVFTAVNTGVTGREHRRHFGHRG